MFFHSFPPQLTTFKVKLETSASFLLDTGAAASLLRKDIWGRAILATPNSPPLQSWTGQHLLSFGSSPLVVHGQAIVPVKFGSYTGNVMFVVTEALTIEAILGLDFMENNGCTLDLKCRLLTLADSTTIPLSPEVKPESTTQLAVLEISTLRIPPTSEVKVMGHVNGNISEYPHILEHLSHKRLPVRVARALVIPSSLGVPVRLMNPTSETVTIYKTSNIATIDSVQR